MECNPRKGSVNHPITKFQVAYSDGLVGDQFSRGFAEPNKRFFGQVQALAPRLQDAPAPLKFAPAQRQSHQ